MSSLDSLADDILKELQNYSEGVTDGVKEATGTVAEEVNAEIKSHITFKQRSTDYVKAFKIKKTTDSRYNRGYTWCVGGDQYRLTHLLENGHAKKGGGRTQAFKHIEYGEELAIKRMEELTRKVIEDA